MRLIATLIIGLFLQISLTAQNDQATPQGLEDILQQFESMFGGNMMIDTMMFKNFNMEGMDQLQGLENLSPEELMEKLGGMGGLGGNGLMMPENLDIEGMMKMLEQSMQGMELGNLEQLLGPLLGDMEGLFPKPDNQKEEERVIIGEDGKPIQQKKKKSQKKVYKL